MQTLRTLTALTGLYVRTRLEYRGALVLMWIAQAFGYIATYGTIWLILSRFEVLRGWTWPDMAFLLGFHILAYASGAAFSFTQMRGIEDLVRKGTFDVLLIKPVSPWAYLVFSGLNIGYGGHIALGIGMCVWAALSADVTWTPGLALFAVGAYVSGAMLVAALMTMIGACALLWGRSRALYAIFFGVWQLARYPLGIYAGPIQAVMLTVMPLAFLAYVPVAVMLGKDVAVLGAWGAPLCLLVGPLAVAVASLHWRYCINHYQGGGG